MQHRSSTLNTLFATPEHRYGRSAFGAKWIPTRCRMTSSRGSESFPPNTERPSPLPYATPSAHDRDRDAALRWLEGGDTLPWSRATARHQPSMSRRRDQQHAWSHADVPCADPTHSTRRNWSFGGMRISSASWNASACATSSGWRRTSTTVPRTATIRRAPPSTTSTRSGSSLRRRSDGAQRLRVAPSRTPLAASRQRRRVI